MVSLTLRILAREIYKNDLESTWPMKETVDEIREWTDLDPRNHRKLPTHLCRSQLGPRTALR